MKQGWECHYIWRQLCGCLGSDGWFNICLGFCFVFYLCALSLSWIQNVTCTEWVTHHCCFNGFAFSALTPMFWASGACLAHENWVTKVQTISIWSGWCHCHPVVSYVVKTRMNYLLGNSISSLSWYRAVKHAFPLCEFVTYWAILMPYWIHITPRLSNCCFPCESGLSSYLLHLFRKKALGDIWHRFFL